MWVLSEAFSDGGTRRPSPRGVTKQHEVTGDLGARRSEASRRGRGVRGTALPRHPSVFPAPLDQREVGTTRLPVSENWARSSSLPAAGTRVLPLSRGGVPGPKRPRALACASVTCSRCPRSGGRVAPGCPLVPSATKECAPRPLRSSLRPCRVSRSLAGAATTRCHRVGGSGHGTCISHALEAEVRDRGAGGAGPSEPSLLGRQVAGRLSPPLAASFLCAHEPLVSLSVP